MLAIESSSLLLSEHAPCFASTANPASSAQTAGEQTYFPLSLMACADVRGILGEGLVQSWQACGSEGQVSGEVAGRPRKHPTGGHGMANPRAGTCHLKASCAVRHSLETCYQVRASWGVSRPCRVTTLQQELRASHVSANPSVHASWKHVGGVRAALGESWRRRSACVGPGRKKATKEGGLARL